MLRATGIAGRSRFWQSAYKPGSVPLAGCRSLIYTMCHHIAKAFYPPARASNPQAPVYMNLQPPRHTARTSLHGRWALTPPSHPYPCGRLFSSALLCLRRQLSVRKWSALCCPDFPPLPFTATATDCPTVFYLPVFACKAGFCAAKVRQNRVINKCICEVLFYRFLVYENVLTLINVWILWYFVIFALYCGVKLIHNRLLHSYLNETLTGGL